MQELTKSSSERTQPSCTLVVMPITAEEGGSDVCECEAGTVDEFDDRTMIVMEEEEQQ